MVEIVKGHDWFLSSFFDVDECCFEDEEEEEGKDVAAEV